MTYDHWKTSNPEDYAQEPPMDDNPTELDLAYERIYQLEKGLKRIADGWGTNLPAEQRYEYCRSVATVALTSQPRPDSEGTDAKAD